MSAAIADPRFNRTYTASGEAVAPRRSSAPPARLIPIYETNTVANDDVLDSRPARHEDGPVRLAAVVLVIGFVLIAIFVAGTAVFFVNREARVSDASLVAGIAGLALILAALRRAERDPL